MAIYRPIHITFWQDDFVLNLTPEEKLFYIYLMTNSKTTQCGIYEISKKVIELDTGYDTNTVEKLIKRFIEYDKIKYSEKTKEIFLVNWLRHNPINNINIQKCVLKEIKKVKNEEYVDILIQFAKELGFNTPLIDEYVKGLTRGLYTPSKE